LNEIDAAMAWLESLAAKQGADEDSLKIVAPEERTDTPPAWITEMAAQENAAESFEPIVPESPVELTDTHVGEVDAGIVSPEPLEVEIQQAIEATHPLGSETAAEPEIPDWLLNYEEEQQRKSETWQALVEPVTPDQAIPSSADENVSIWLQRHHPEQGTGPLEPPASKEDEAPAWIPEPVVDEVAPAPIGSPLAEAQSAMQQGEIDKAVDLYSSLVESGDHIDETIHDLHEALYRHPVDVGIWQALGDAYIRADKIQEALDAYTKAEELLR